MSYLLNSFFVWLEAGLIILVSGWYTTVIMPSFFPYRRKRVVVDVVEPDPPRLRRL